MDTTKLIDRARSSARKRDYDSAVEMYMQALEFNPNDAGTRVELHKLYIREQQENPKGRGSGIFGGLMRKAKSMISSPKTKEQADKALIDLEKSLRSNPSDYGLVNDMGKAGLVAQYYDMVIALMQDVRAAKAGGDMEKRCDCLRTLGFAYKGAEKWSEAIEVFGELAKLMPTDREAAKEARDMAANLQTSRGIKTSTPGAPTSGEGGKNVEVSEKDMVLALLRTGIKTTDDANLLMRHYHKEMQGDVKDPMVFEKATEPYLFLGKYAEAKALLDKAQALQPTDPRWGFKKDDVEIRRYTDQLKPLQAKARSGDAAAKEQFHKINAELIAFKFESFSKREQQYPTESAYKQELGRIAFQKKDYDEALRCFQFTRNDPKYQVESLTYLGRSFRSKKQYDLSIRALTEGIDRMQVMNDAKKQMIYERALTFELVPDKDKYRKDLTTLYESDVRYKDVQVRLDKLAG